MDNTAEEIIVNGMPDMMGHIHNVINAIEATCDVASPASITSGASNMTMVQIINKTKPLMIRLGDHCSYKNTTKFINWCPKYYAGRGHLVARAVRSPHINDYVTAVQVYDANEKTGLQGALVDVMNECNIVQSLLVEHLDIIKRPTEYFE
ncbi:uncharacterized protein LOC109597027 [Aethina tumida]|uniref:uncharacterized protein LOC109597027 n=1 Tax=Aethina tumida TaxID=116153 RepID=UPI00214802D9|nr:uncharacterized protein LOC109597027 [Aethina tumida]